MLQHCDVCHTFRVVLHSDSREKEEMLRESIEIVMRCCNLHLDPSVDERACEERVGRMERDVEDMILCEVQRWLHYIVIAHR